MKNETCPLCKKPSEDRFRPFCSQRCSHIDLGCWLDGTYSIAGEEKEGSVESFPLPQEDPHEP